MTASTSCNHVRQISRRVLIEVALMDNNEEVKDLLRHFGLKEVLTLNAESTVRIDS